MLDPLQLAVLIFYLVTSMAGIGLRVDLRDLGATVARKDLLLRSLAVNYLVVPALGWLVTRIVPMAPLAADAILVLACAPGGVTAVQFTSKRKDVLAFAGTTALLLTASSILLSPLLMSLLLPAELSLVVPYARGFGYLVLFMLLPIALGILLRHRAEHLADRLGRPVALVGTLAFFLFIGITMQVRRDAMAEIGGAEVAAIVGFILASGVVGWLSGGPGRETRQVLAAATSMRNVALSLAIAARSFPDAGIQAPLAAFCALMITPNMIFLVSTLVMSRLRRRA